MRLIPLTIGVVFLVSSPPARGDESPKELIASGQSLLGTPREKEGLAQLEKAIGLLEKSIKREPKSDELQFEPGLAHFYLGQDKPAMSALDQSIKLNARHAGAHFFKGVLLRRQKKLEAALVELEQAKSLDPKKAKCWYEWGSALLEKGDDRAGRKAFEEAIRLDPKHLNAIYSLGVLDAQEGKMEPALEKYRKVIELDPSSTDAQYNAGQACQTLGKPAESLAYFRAAAKLEPDDIQIAAKVVQCCQALKQSKERDIARQRVMKLFKEGKATQKFYCRDQFSMDKFRVMVFEYFEMKGEEAVRFSFQVRDDDHEDPIYRVSLGSYDVTNEHAHNIGTVSGDERLFHLDRYFPSGRHETFAFFKGEPKYEKVRAMVERIVKGKIKPTSSTTPTSQGSTIEFDPNQ